MSQHVPPEHVRKSAKVFLDQYTPVVSSGAHDADAAMAASIAAGESFDDLEILRLSRSLKDMSTSSVAMRALGGIDAYKWVSDTAKRIRAVAASGVMEPNQDTYLLLHPNDPGVVLGLVKTDGEAVHRWEGSGWSQVPEDCHPQPEWPVIQITTDNQYDVADLLVQMDAHDSWGPVQAYCSHCGDHYAPMIAAAGPDDQDVPVFAILDPLSPDSVTEMFSVPQPQRVVAFREGAWQDAPDLMPRLVSPDPPAVVRLSKQGIENVTRSATQAYQQSLKDTPEQDAETEVEPEPVVAAPAAATSRMPLKLRKYWLGPKGRAKIRWGTKGSFGRCQRQMRKHMPPYMVNGACANLYKQATGRWPGRRGNKR